VRYWTYLVAKLFLVFGIASVGWKGLHAIWPEPEPFMRVKLEPFARDLSYTIATWIFGLVVVGLVYLVILDQRYRCRTCLRRLHMPVLHGGWSQIFLGPPRTVYICRYGHGKLSVPELGLENPEKPDWSPIHDMWQELYELEETRK
jgi:hypothetical protein